MLFSKRHHSFIFYLLIVIVIFIFGVQFSQSIKTASATAFDSKSSGTGTWTHTTGTSSNMVLLVGVTGNPTSVKYNGITLTKLASAVSGSASTSLWYLMNPQPGAHSVVISGTGIKGGAETYYNVSSVSLFGQPVKKSYGFCPQGSNCQGNSVTLLQAVSGTSSNQPVFSTAAFTSSNASSVSVWGTPALWSFSSGASSMSLGATNVVQSGGTSLRIQGTNLTYNYVDIAATLNPIPQTPIPTPTPIQQTTPTPALTPNLTPILPTGTTYSISGDIFIDANTNGIKDSDESNTSEIPSITASRGTTTINANGTYTISNLSPGTVTIYLNTLPQGYSMTYPLNGPPPSFQVSVGPGCTTNEARGASCE